MHAGSGLRNKLNLTSSIESWYGQGAVIYYVFIVWVFVKRKQVFHNNPGPYPASTAHQQLICLGVYLVYLCSLTQEKLSD